MQIKKKKNWKRAIEIFVFVSLVLSIGYASVKVFLAPPGAVTEIPHEKLKSDYVLMLLQCILGVVVMYLPKYLGKRYRVEIPSIMYLLFVIFLYCAIYLGEVRSFYYQIPHWDTILHVFSGGLLGVLGFSMVSLLNNSESVTVEMTPLFVAIFAFCFAVTLGAIWEIYEFTFDGLLGLNMQKFALENGEPLIGREALQDTMKDIIVDCIGAGVVSVIGYFSICKNGTWVLKHEFKRIEDGE